MKRILPLLLILLLILTGCSAKNADSPAADAPTDTPLTGTSYVQIDVKDYGTIVAELYADTAPITVANFLSLVDSGFYDGLTFHRIISGFMIQGGDPNGNGTGGSSQRIKGEFSANGVQNDLKHTRGVLSMARSSAMDSASSAVLFSTQPSQANTTTRARHTSATVTQTFPTFFFMVLSSFLHLVFVFRYL